MRVWDKKLINFCDRERDCKKMKRMLQFINSDKAAKGKIALLLVLYALQALFQVAQPEVLNQAMGAIGDGNWPVLKAVVIAAVFVTAGTLLVDAAIKLRMVSFSNVTLQNIQTDLMDRIMRFQRKRFQKNEIPDYLTGIVDHAESAVQSSVYCFFSVCSSVLILLVCTLYMCYLSIPLTLIVVAFNIALRLVLSIVEKKIKQVADVCNQVVKENNGFLVELLSNMLTIRTYREREYFERKFFGKEKETYKSHIRMNLWWKGQSEFVWCSLKFAEYVLVYGIGGVLYYRGLIDFGLFLAYPIAMDYFVKGINLFMYTLVNKNMALSAMDALKWLYEKADMEEGRHMSPEEEEAVRTGEIRLEHVTFSYQREDGTAREILRDVSFVIEPGDKVLLQGPNGEGKSTLLYLISGQYRPDSGQILYGGIPTEKVSLKALSEKYRFISQENDLFHCDVPGNIELSLEADREACKRVLEKLRMEDRLEMEASHLSQGEKQRVNIARALRKGGDGRIFLLGDEITANIDPQNAQNIYRLLQEEFAQNTVILVSHGDCGFVWNKRITVESGHVVVEEAQVQTDGTWGTSAEMKTWAVKTEKAQTTGGSIGEEGVAERRTEDKTNGGRTSGPARKVKGQTSLFLFFEFVKKQWFLLALTMLLLTGFAVLRTYSTSFISEIVGSLQSKAPLSEATGLALLGAAVACLSYVIRFAGHVLCVVMGEKLALKTRCRLTEHLFRIPWSEYERQKTGQLQTVIRNDVQQGADMISSIFSYIALSLFLFMATLVYMFIIAPVPALVITGFTVFMVFVNQQVIIRQKGYSKRARDAAGEVAETVLTSCKGMSTIKSYRAERFILRLLGEKKRSYNNAVYRAELIDAVRVSAYNLTSSFVLYATILLMGSKGIRGEVSWGDILVFIVLVRQVIMPAELIFWGMGQVAGGIAAWERVSGILRLAAPAEPGELPAPEETIVAKEVSFSYGQGAEILRDLSLELKKGEIGALIGESGSGKTTLCKILCGLYGEAEWRRQGSEERQESGQEQKLWQEPYELHGKWILDGKTREGGTVPWCIYNPAEPELFHMSIYENIVFGQTQISREECMALAEELGAADFIRGLSNGIDTVIEAGGRTLSGGQRQQIANLRALLSGKKMLILDEAFASLDVERRQRLLEVLKKRRSVQFILLVTHERGVCSENGGADTFDMKEINKLACEA